VIFLVSRRACVRAASETDWDSWLRAGGRCARAQRRSSQASRQGGGTGTETWGPGTNGPAAPRASRSRRLDRAEAPRGVPGGDQRRGGDGESNPRGGWTEQNRSGRKQLAGRRTPPPAAAGRASDSRTDKGFPPRNPAPGGSERAFVALRAVGSRSPSHIATAPRSAAAGRREGGINNDNKERRREKATAFVFLCAFSYPWKIHADLPTHTRHRSHADRSDAPNGGPIAIIALVLAPRSPIITRIGSVITIITGGDLDRSTSSSYSLIAGPPPPARPMPTTTTRTAALRYTATTDAAGALGKIFWPGARIASGS
jgi:hypothetical protein